MNYYLAAAAIIAAVLLLGAAADADVVATGDDALRCEMQGGRTLVTHERLAERMRAAYAAGQREARAACRPMT